MDTKKIFFMFLSQGNMYISEDCATDTMSFYEMSHEMPRNASLICVSKQGYKVIHKDKKSTEAIRKTYVLRKWNKRFRLEERSKIKNLYSVNVYEKSYQIVPPQMN